MGQLPSRFLLYGNQLFNDVVFFEDQTERKDGAGVEIYLLNAAATKQLSSIVINVKISYI